MSTAKKIEQTYYRANKYEATFTPKVLQQLLDCLNKTAIEGAKHVLVIENESSIVTSFFASRIDAEYCYRKLKKVIRLSFAGEYRLRIENK